jgi:hypothetical protein
MPTRYTAQSQTRFNMPGLPSGYQTKSSSELVIPSVGIEDVDKALFALFNEEIPLLVGGDGTDLKRCPIVFFAGEKWALNKRLRALKDVTGALVLPLCTVIRTSVTQDPASDITGRGINQQTGEIVIHRRLDKSDRAYQGLINRLFLKHQTNLAVSPGQQDVGQLTTMRDLGDLADDPIVRQGGLLIPDRTNNVYETIVVPSPQFFTAQYDVTLWTQYTTHMNQLLESIIASQLPQGNVWRIDSPKGYWFLANVVDNAYTADTNTDDYSQTERLVRYKFVIKVPAYIMASKVPGAPVPIKRYVSSPSISFDVGAAAGTYVEPAGEDDPFLGADDPTLPLNSDDQGLRPQRRDQRNRTDTRLMPPNSLTNPDDPALQALPRGTAPAQYQKVTGIDKSGKLVTRLLRIKATNKAQGETVLASDATLGGLSIVVTDD